jgi:hypothetical protein
MQQRDDALHQIEQMRQLLIHNMRLLPSDHDLMQLTLDDVKSLKTRLQQELLKLSNVNLILDFFRIFKYFSFQIEQAKINPTQQASPVVTSTTTSVTTTTTSSPRQRQPKHHSGKHVLVSSSSKH